MQSILEIDGKADDFKKLLSELTEALAITDHDLQALRHAFYRLDVIDRRCAAEVFHANRVMGIRHDGWTELYLEILTDFFLEYQRDGHALTGESEATLLAWLDEEASMADLGERRLVARLLFKAKDVSERFERRVLDAIRENLLHQTGRWLGEGRRVAGVVDALDMQLIRRSVHGAGGQYRSKISRVAIDFLVDLDQQVSSFKEPMTWRSLLMEAVTLYLHTPAQPERMAEWAGEDIFRDRLMAWFDSGCSAAEAGSVAKFTCRLRI